MCYQDVDLIVGGTLESHVEGSQFGPTFLCIAIEQFKITRTTDRFWFENGEYGSFRVPQLAEIRKATFARILCDNSNNIKKTKKNPFLLK